MQNKNSGYLQGKVGLFYGTVSGSLIKDVSLEQWTLSGVGDVGGLVYQNQGELQNIIMTDSSIVSQGDAGDLVFRNLGTISNSQITPTLHTHTYFLSFLPNPGDII